MIMAQMDSASGARFHPHTFFKKLESHAILSPIPSTYIFGKQQSHGILVPIHTKFGEALEWSGLTLLWELAVQSCLPSFHPRRFWRSSRVKVERFHSRSLDPNSNKHIEFAEAVESWWRKFTLQAQLQHTQLPQCKRGRTQRRCINAKGEGHSADTSMLNTPFPYSRTFITQCTRRSLLPQAPYQQGGSLLAQPPLVQRGSCTRMMLSTLIQWSLSYFFWSSKNSCKN